MEMNNIFKKDLLDLGMIFTEPLAKLLDSEIKILEFKDSVTIIYVLNIQQAADDAMMPQATDAADAVDATDNQ